MKKKITLAVLIAVVALGLTACTNTEVSSVGTTTTPVTTPVVTTVNTTTTEATTTSEQLTTEPSSDVVTSEEQTEAVVSDETTTATSEQEEVTTTTSEQLGSTTTTKKPTTVTTTKTTTTKKPTVTTTTTKKKTTTTTTTTKKKTTTTTTTTAKKQEITNSPVIKITQSDVDKLVNELQEYSDSLETDAKTDLEFQEFLIKKYGSLEAWYEHRANTLTPSNSSWHTVISWSEYQTNTEKTFDEIYSDKITQIKECLDLEYEILPNSHQVVYAEYTTNSYTGDTKWSIYLLY